MGKPGAQIVGCANLVFNRPTEERPKSTSTWRGRTHRPGSLQRQFVRSHPGEVDRERVHQVPHSQVLTLVEWTTRGCTKLHTPNRCLWTIIQPIGRIGTWMKIDAPESGVFPESCVQGPGWQRTHFKEDICSLVRLDYLQDQYFLVKAKTKCKDNNDIPFDTICDNSTKAMEVKKGTSSIHVIFVSMLGGLIIPAGILVNVLVFFCSQCHEEGSFFC